MKFKQRIVNKKAVKTAVCTALMLGSIGLADFQKSYPKLMREETDVLTYNTRLKSHFYNGKGIINTLSDGQTKENVPLQFNFKRNDLGKGINDKYTIKPSDACKITSVSNINNGISLDKSSYDYGEEVNIIYDSDQNTDVTHSVNMTCKVENIKYETDNKTYMKTDVAINETIEETSKEYTFSYMDYAYNYNYDLYMSQFTTTVPDEFEVKEEELTYENFKTWLINYLKQNNIPDGNIIYYVDQYYDSGNKFNYDDIKSGNIIKGITTSTTDDKLYLVVENSLLGHARTYLYKNNPQIMFFSPNASETEINNAFEYYVDTYLAEKDYTEKLYDYNQDQLDAIKNYIIENNIIYNVIYNNQSFEGIYSHTVSTDDNTHKIILDTELILILTGQIVVENNINRDEYSRMVSDYTNIINEFAKDGIISDKLKENLINPTTYDYIFDRAASSRNNLTDLNVENPRQNTLRAFTDYNIHYDEDKKDFVIAKFYGAFEGYKDNNELSDYTIRNYIEMDAVNFSFTNQNGNYVDLDTTGSLNIAFDNIAAAGEEKFAIAKRFSNDLSITLIYTDNDVEVFNHIVNTLYNYFDMKGESFTKPNVIASDIVEKDDNGTIKYTYTFKFTKEIVGKPASDTSSEDNTPSNVSSGILSAKKPSLDINNDSNTENEESNTNTETNGNNNVADNNASDKKLNNGTQNIIPSTSDQTVTQSNTLSDTLKKVQEDQSTTKDNQISNSENNILQNEFENVSANVNEQ